MLEAMEVSLQLAGRVLERLGVSEAAVNDRLAAAREVERERIYADNGSMKAGG